MSEEQQDPIGVRVARLLGYYGVLVQGGNLAPDQHTVDEIEGIAATAAALRVSLANEMRRRWAAEDERDQHEAEWSAELAALRARVIREAVEKLPKAPDNMVQVPGYWRDGHGTVCDPTALLDALLGADGGGSMREEQVDEALNSGDGSYRP